MTTGHVTALLSPYIDDQVSPAERDRVTRHLDTCEACRRDLAALREVVGLVRSATPVPAPEALRAEVRARVEAIGGSPGGQGWLRGAWPQLAWPRLAGAWRPALAAAALVLIGVFAANLLGPQGAHPPIVDRQEKGGAPAMPRPAMTGPVIQMPGARSKATAEAPQDAADVTRPVGQPQYAAPAPGAGQTPDAMFRSVIRTARLALEVDQYDAGARRLLEIAEGVGGFIADSSFNEVEGGPQGEFALRVPAARFGAVVRDVEAMGTVRQRQISAQDVTEEFVDLQARQRNLERHEQQLLSFMDRAAKVSDLLAVEQELARVRGQIEQITGRLRYLGHNVEMASVTVTLSQRVKKSAAFWDLGATLTKMQTAFAATIRQILGVAEGAAVLASAALPWLVIGGIAWGAIYRARRGRASA